MTIDYQAKTNHLERKEKKKTSRSMFTTTSNRSINSL